MLKDRRRSSRCSRVSSDPVRSGLNCRSAMAAEYAKACVKTPPRFLNFWLTDDSLTDVAALDYDSKACAHQYSRPPPSLAGGSPMKLYTSVGPNPRVVKMFLAEKGLDLPRVTVDLMGGENRRAPY